MKIIDAHLHFSKGSGFDGIARTAGHENTPECLGRVFEECGIAIGIAMGEAGGNRNAGYFTPATPNLSGEFPPGKNTLPKFMVYCAGIHSAKIIPSRIRETVAAFELQTADPRCVGLKLYPGYNLFYPNDPVHYPFYELAEARHLPVVFHSGEVAGHGGLLKYSHPLCVDEAAVNFPRVNFVIAHCGNPWIQDAVAVAAKNPNVFLDLSGLAEGNFTADSFLKQFGGHMGFLKTWLDYLNDWEKPMYGSDWPLLNIPAWIEVLSRIVPPEHHEEFFFRNALRVFPKLRALIR